jgi:hypothetical protein
LRWVLIVSNEHDIPEDDLHSAWEAALGHPLTPTEFEELKENLYGFFNLLHEWDLQDQMEASAADGACIDSNAGGGPHD